jgi:hypothetical protein
VLAVAGHAGDVAEGAAVGDLDPVTRFFSRYRAIR